MKFSIDAKVLVAGLQAASKVVERRNTIPILGNAVVEAEGSGIRLRATDLDMEISIGLSAAVAEAGSTTVPALLFQDIARKVSGDVTFTLEEGRPQATVSAGRSKFNLHTLPVVDFPSITAGNFSHSFEIPGDALAGMMSDTHFCMSSEETRYYLNGVYLHTQEVDHKLMLRAVATDGHRMARYEITAPDGVDGMPGVIVPRKAVGEIITIAENAKNNLVRISLSDTKIQITHGTTVLTSKLIDGTFPDYQRVIPTGNNMVANVYAQHLADAADRVSTLNSKRGRAVKLAFSRGWLTLSVNDPDTGYAEDAIEADFDADNLDIGFNAAYLRDALNHTSGGKVRLAMNDSGSPTLLTDEEKPQLLQVLMPMRV